jgi:Fe2+ transport system protein FeoA
MGLLPGAKLEVIRSAMGGPVVVRVKETKLVLGRGMARKIMVE